MPASSISLIPWEWRVLYQPLNTTYWNKRTRYYDQLTIEGHFFGPDISDESYSHQSISLQIFSSTIEQINGQELYTDEMLLPLCAPLYSYQHSIYFSGSSFDLSIELSPGYSISGSPLYISGSTNNGTKTVAQFNLTDALQTSSQNFLKFGSIQGIQIQLDSISKDRDGDKSLLQNISLLYDTIATGVIVTVGYPLTKKGAQKRRTKSLPTNRSPV